MVLLLSLVGDHLLRHAAKGIKIPFRAGADELSKQLAVRHDSDSYPFSAVDLLPSAVPIWRFMVVSRLPG